MNNKELEKYLYKYYYNFSFLDNIENIKNIVTIDNNKHSSEYYTESKAKIKQFIKDEIAKEYKKDKDKFISKVLSQKINKRDVDEYLKLRILDMIYGVINDKKINREYFRNLITNKASLRKVLENVFLEEDRDATVLAELKEKYKHLHLLLDTYKEFFFKFDPNKKYLTLEEYKKLFGIIRGEDSTPEEIKEAKDEIIMRNIGLVQKEAAHYSDKNNALINFEDLYHDGIEGMYKAIEKFDFAKKVRFTTYALIWVRQAIHRSIDNNSRTIRIPVHKIEKMNKIGKAASSIEKEFGTLSSTEMAQKIAERIEDFPVTLEDFLEFRKNSVIPKSLDEAIREDDGEQSDSIVKFIPSSDNVEEEAIKRVDKEIMEDLMVEVLNPRQLYVLYYRFGFDGIEKTCEELAHEFGVSKQRINQIEVGAFAKLARIYKAKTKFDLVNKDNMKDYEKAIDNAKRRNLSKNTRIL